MKHTIPTLNNISLYLFNKHTREFWMIVCFVLYMCTNIPYVTVPLGIIALSLFYHIIFTD